MASWHVRVFTFQGRGVDADLTTMCSHRARTPFVGGHQSKIALGRDESSSRIAKPFLALCPREVSASEHDIAVLADNGPWITCARQCRVRGK